MFQSCTWIEIRAKRAERNSMGSLEGPITPALFSLSTERFNMVRLTLMRFLLAAVAIAAGPARAAPDEQGYVNTAPGVSVYFERYGSGPETVIIPNRLFMPQMKELARP